MMKKHLTIMLLTVCSLSSLKADWLEETWETVKKPGEAIVETVVTAPRFRILQQIIQLNNQATRKLRQAAQTAKKSVKRKLEKEAEKLQDQAAKLRITHKV